MDITTQGEGELFIHRELWEVATRQLQQAVASSSGSFYPYLTAMIFAFHALEAYLNWAGIHLAPKDWAKEREFFGRSGNWPGFDGKIRYVLQLCCLPEPLRSSRPYSTVWTLKALRDFIAHGKPEQLSYSSENSNAFLQSKLDDWISRENATAAIADIETFINEVHQAARNVILARPGKVIDVWFNAPKPLRGPMRHGSYDTRMQP